MNVSVLLYLHVIYISYHIHSLGSLITSGSSRQAAMEQVLVSYFIPSLLHHEQFQAFPQIFSSADNAMYAWFQLISVCSCKVNKTIHGKDH